MIFVLIFISNIDDVLLSSRENNVPDESLIERYVIRRMNVSGKLDPVKRNENQRIDKAKLYQNFD